MIGNEVAKIYGKCGDMVDESTLLEIYDMLYPFTQMSTEVKQNHIDNIRDKYIAQNVVENDDKETHEDSAASTPIPKEDAQPCERESADSDADLICPKCGGKLVLKASKKGAHAGESFYGCSNFPKCRYIKK
jgi:hypothetical protein